MSKQDLLTRPVAVINLGLRSFHDDLRRQGAPCVHLDWRPACAGKPELLALVERLREREAPIPASPHPHAHHAGGKGA